MIKTLSNLLKQDKEKYKVPRKVQDVIPIRRMWSDGIFQVGSKFSKSYQFSDINYQVASLEDKKVMFLDYSELLNSLDSGATTKITINNRRLNRANFEQSILMPLRGDSRDVYRREYNQMLLDKATGANGIMQEKYITITVGKKNIEDARTYFARVGADLTAHFAALGSKCVELDATERLRILHDFYRQGEEADFHFNARDMMKKGHDFRDYICPDGIEKHSDYLVLGGTFCRVLFLKDYANYIKDSFVTELTDMNRNLMLSIDVVPIPMDEAVREVENRLLGVETNITNWQRRQNANNNFSATIPYDMEQQRKESKEFLDDLTARDQRMMMAVLTMVLTADTKEQLDADTDAVLSLSRQKMCQMAVLKFQQLDGLNTVLPIGTRKINAFRTLTTESLAVFMPFKVQEVQDKGGIYFGENAISHNLILCNKANLLNQSAFLLGVPGSERAPSNINKGVAPLCAAFCGSAPASSSASNKAISRLRSRSVNPYIAAQCNGVKPCASCACTSAPVCNKRATTSGKPSAAAKINTVTAPGRRRSVLHPACSNRSTISNWRLLTAADSGVAPVLAARSGLAPCASRYSTKPRWPLPEARSKAVQPCASTASTENPSASNRCSACKSPLTAAAGTSKACNGRCGSRQIRQSSHSTNSR